MFEAQRVTVGELTKCEQRVYEVGRVVQEFNKEVRLCDSGFVRDTKNLVFVIFLH